MDNTTESEVCPDETTPEMREDISSFFLTSTPHYCNGQLVGTWVEMNKLKSLEELQEIVTKFLLEHRVDSWFISDFENFPDLGECPNLEKVWFVFSQYEEHSRDVINAFLDCYGLEDLTEDVITDHYQGAFESPVEYAENWVTETGLLSGVPELVARYFDYEAFARDLRLGGDITYSRQGGKYFIFTPL